MPTFKNPREMAQDLNKTLDITNEVNDLTKDFKREPNEDYEDFEGRVWSHLSNHYGRFLNPDAINNVAATRAKELYFGSPIDDDYERSYGPVVNDEQYNAYLKWLENNK